MSACQVAGEHPCGLIARTRVRVTPPESQVTTIRELCVLHVQPVLRLKEQGWTVTAEAIEQQTNPSDRSSASTEADADSQKGTIR